VLLKERDLLTKHSTMLSNAIRGHAAEFGVTGAKGPQKIKELLERIAGETNVPEPARELLNSLASQLAAIKVRLAALEAKLMAHHKADPRSQLLAPIPGVGPVTAVSIALKVPDATVLRPFRSAFCRLARDHAARTLDGGAAAARQDQPARRRRLAPAAGAGCHCRHPAGRAASPSQQDKP